MGVARWLVRLTIVILACAGALCALESLHRPARECGIYAAKGDQFFVALQNRRIFVGIAERYAFPWQNSQGPFDDLNVAGPAEKAPFGTHWTIGRFTDSTFLWVAPDRPNRFSCEWFNSFIDGGAGHSNYADRIKGEGIAASTRSVAAALLTFPSFYLASMISRRLAQHRRKRSRRCVQCNYDLRASTDRCPECGASISTGGTMTASPP